MKLYMVQPGYVYGQTKKSAYFPYAAGTVAACAFSDNTVAQNYTFGGFTCFFDEIDEAAFRMKDADVVGFSNYVWNFRYNCMLAQRIKILNSSCIIIFGGHQIEKNFVSLNKLNFVDFLIFGEGEEVFTQLLKEIYSSHDYYRICNISFRDKNNETVITQDGFPEFNDYPSPYTMGLFDGLMSQYNDISFHAIFETSRGCPYQCAYCDWGITKQRLKMFPHNRIRDEIKWFSDKKIEECFAADANFGLLETDLTVAKMLVESKNKTGYPKRFDVTYAKENADNVFEIVSLLYKNGMSGWPAISFQSLNEKTLKAIGRVNWPLEKFAAQLKKYEAAQLRPYSEIIMGLPEETYKSFCRGIGTLLDYGQHNYIDIFRCEILPNSRMAQPDYIKKYDIKYIEVPSTLHHISQSSRETGYGSSNIVVSTSTMSTDEMLRANLFSMLIQSCHHMGALKYISVYCRRSLNITYDDFYEKLLRWLENDDSGFFGKLFVNMKKSYSDFLNARAGLEYVNSIFGDITWFPEEGFFLEIALHLEEFYCELEGFFNSMNIPEIILDELVSFQKFAVKTLKNTNTGLKTQYDFYSFFFEHTQQTKPEKRTVKIFVQPVRYQNWQDFARKCVWFGRRRGETDMFVSNNSISVER